jgi:aerobic carbon-monoxide dehydrogenase small subunit
MKTSVTLTINGETREHLVEARTSLADMLRESMRLTATHLGCEQGVCGACTILVDGQPARACLILAVAGEGLDIRTLEGMGDDTLMRMIKDSFHQEHGLQCGFCTPGMLISSWDLIKRRGALAERDIRVAMSGNLCRCTGYQNIVRSIKAASESWAARPEAYG